MAYFVVADFSISRVLAGLSEPGCLTFFQWVSTCIKSLTVHNVSAIIPNDLSNDRECSFESFVNASDMTIRIVSSAGQDLSLLLLVCNVIVLR